MTTIRNKALAALAVLTLFAAFGAQPAAALTDGATVQNVYWHRHYYHHRHWHRHYGAIDSRIHQA